jgi:RNA polymerase sigma-70 factor (ECF subfamily)
MSEIVKFKGRVSDQVRFERLMQPHFEALYGAASRLAFIPADAEDLVQEVCVKAFIKLSDLEVIQHQQAWLLRMLYNVFIDSVRRNQRSPVDLAGSSQPVDEMELAGDRRLQPEEETDRLISLNLLWNAMKILKKEDCALLALHDIEGHSIAELATLTELPESTIKSRLHRTRIKLGRLMQREVTGLPHLTLVGTRT